jgi:hypothetical protein
MCELVVSESDTALTTVRGNALAGATFGKPVNRITARRHLAQVVERARAYNADPGRLLTIAQITVFGSYLDPAAAHLCSLDLAVSAARRDSDRILHVQKVLAYARASGRTFAAFHELLYWPAWELKMILKNRSPAISITDDDVSTYTDHFKIVYAVSEDRDAIPAPPNAASER